MICPSILSRTFLEKMYRISCFSEKSLSCTITKYISFQILCWILFKYITFFWMIFPLGAPHIFQALCSSLFWTLSWDSWLGKKKEIFLCSNPSTVLFLQFSDDKCDYTVLGRVFCYASMGSWHPHGVVGNRISQASARTIVSPGFMMPQNQPGFLLNSKWWWWEDEDNKTQPGACCSCCEQAGSLQDSSRARALQNPVMKHSSGNLRSNPSLQVQFRGKMVV